MQCEETTKKDARCRNSALKNERFCRLHMKQKAPHFNSSATKEGTDVSTNGNLPEWIYRITDVVLKKIMNILISPKEIEKRLLFERDMFEVETKDESKRTINYSIKMVAIIHGRASSMVSHLSIMLALCLFLLPSAKESAGTLEHIIVMGDTFLYIMLVIFSVRCLRSLGLDRDYKDAEEYANAMMAELTYKYCMMQVINSVTILATVILVGALVMISL